MRRLRSASAVLPALVPAACVAVLAFQAGGFYPSSYGLVAAVLAVVLALRIATVGRPFAGVSAWSGVAIGALALLAAWMLLSAGWSHAPGRALIEFARALMYLLVLVLCASLAPRENRLSWAIRGVTLAVTAVCVAGLATRLRPDLWNEAADFGRLDYPVTYWNGLGILAAVGVVLGLHLTASSREPRLVRVLAAGVPVVAATTVYFTLSRGAIIAGAVALAVYLVVGFSRATPGALLAVVPPAALALTRIYDAEILVSLDHATPEGIAEGKDAVRVLALAVVASMVLRAVALLVDMALDRLPSPAQLPRPARLGAALAVVAAVAVAAVAAGVPGFAERQLDTFLDKTPPPVSGVQSRLTVINNNGRVAHWTVALDAWRAERLHGHGAGTYENLWNEDRDLAFRVMDAHSLYFEVMSELGLVGIGLLALGLLTIVVGLVWRLPRPGRPGVAAVLAATVGWLVHAGVDWDWELTSVTVWMFGLAGIALAPAALNERRPMPRLLRLVAALCCLLLALTPAALWMSQIRLTKAVQAFDRGDCRATVDHALDSLSAVNARAEPWELIAYCDVRLGQPQLAIGAAEAAARRDPGNWEYRYALALVRGASGQDPRPAIREAARLNPLQPEVRIAQKAFDTKRPKLWERRARALKLYRG